MKHKNFCSWIKSISTEDFNKLLKNPIIKQLHNVGPDAEEYMKSLQQPRHQRHYRLRKINKK